MPVVNATKLGGIDLTLKNGQDRVSFVVFKKSWLKKTSVEMLLQRLFQSHSDQVHGRAPSPALALLPHRNRCQGVRHKLVPGYTEVTVVATLLGSPETQVLNYKFFPLSDDFFSHCLKRSRSIK